MAVETWATSMLGIATGKSPVNEQARETIRIDVEKRRIRLMLQSPFIN
jgi:hypothetical protein